ncbi:MAG: cellulose-binding protein [Candidatus Schekmanbacteria bacterium]|nr:cellulose-binding protein [Candidatus Schekmanbacteria bacterium]
MLFWLRIGVLAVVWLAPTPPGAATLDPVELATAPEVTPTTVVLTWQQTTTTDSEFACYRVLRSTEPGADIDDTLVSAAGPAAAALALLLLGAALRTRRALYASCALGSALLLMLAARTVVNAAVFLSDCIGPKSTLSYVDTDLKRNTPYFYKVYVFGTDGAYAGSNEVAATTSRASNYRAPLGVNLEGPRDWNPDWIFVDVFRVARKWITLANPYSWDTGEYDELDLDADGWVRSLPAADDPTVQYRMAATVLFAGLSGHFPAGRYTVLYDGEGSLAYDWDASKNASLSAPGRDVVDVVPGNDGMLLRLDATDPARTGSYVRNIRVIPPGGSCNNDRSRYCDSNADCVTGARCDAFLDTYERERFHPYFLRTVARFKAFRVMNWLNVCGPGWSGNTMSEWSERATLTHYTWSADLTGVPVEIIVELANKLAADLWIAVTLRASDDFIRQLAQMVHDRLDPGLRVLVEYGNEVWNPAFCGTDWVEQQAEAEWPEAPVSGYAKRLNWHGKRTVEMCALWRAAWAEDSDRFTCVLGAQGATLWTGTQALDCPLWSQAPCANQGIDAVAIAPYFGYYVGEPANEATVTQWLGDPDGGLGKLFEEIMQGGLLAGGPTGGAVQEALDDADAYVAEVTENRGLQVVAYEGGQHLSTRLAGLVNPTISALFNEANRDARMGTAYEKLLDGWRASGMNLFMHFGSTGRYDEWGSFGLKEWAEQTATPKFDTVMQFISDNACWWQGCEQGGRSGLSANTLRRGEDDTTN